LDRRGNEYRGERHNNHLFREKGKNQAGKSAVKLNQSKYHGKSDGSPTPSRLGLTLVFSFLHLF
jgi:hypothetical protein